MENVQCPTSKDLQAHKHESWLNPRSNIADFLLDDGGLSRSGSLELSLGGIYLPRGFFPVLCPSRVPLHEQLSSAMLFWIGVNQARIVIKLSSFKWSESDTCPRDEKVTKTMNHMIGTPTLKYLCSTEADSKTKAK